MKIIFLPDQPSVSIANINNLVIEKYFISLNSNDFIAVSELFAAEGCLYPPFEKPVCGRGAIAEYLQAEAKGIKSFPYYGSVHTGNDNNTIYLIQGSVKTSLFTVNVSWSIQLNPEEEIIAVEVKLLAALQDLLALKHN